MAASLNISLPEPLKAHVDAKVQTGQYGTASEYLSDLIRHDQARQHAEDDQELADLERRLLLAVQKEEGGLELTADQVRAGGVVSLIRHHLAATR
jgi:antitoxin ParD1/3/4